MKTKIQTTTKTTVRLTRSELLGIIGAASSVLDIPAIPDDARVYVMPNNGEWSSTAVDVDDMGAGCVFFEWTAKS